MRNGGGSPGSGTASEPGPGRILVTGAAGFIGSHLVERLLAEGYEVWGIDNFEQGYAPGVKRDNVRRSLRDPRMHMVEGDVRDDVLLDGVFGDRSFDAVMHLAALPGTLSPGEDPQICFQVNLMGAVHLLEAMRRRNVRRIVFTSDRVMPDERVESGAGREDPADRPPTSFAAAKRSVELLCHAHYRTYGTSVRVLRLSRVYGPRETPDGPVHQLARRLVGDAPAACEVTEADPVAYLYVDDAVEALVASLQSLLEAPQDEPAFEIHRVSGRERASATELERRLKRALEIDDADDADDAVGEGDGAGEADIAAPEASGGRGFRVPALPGFEPAVGLDEGLARFAEWFSGRYAAGSLNVAGVRPPGVPGRGRREPQARSRAVPSSRPPAKDPKGRPRS